MAWVKSHSTQGEAFVVVKFSVGLHFKLASLLLELDVSNGNTCVCIFLRISFMKTA